MDSFTDLLSQQRQLTPPPGVVDQLEMQVMARLDRLPRERRHKVMLAGGLSLCGVLVVLALYAVIRPRVEPTRASGFC